MEDFAGECQRTAARPAQCRPIRLPSAPSRAECGAERVRAALALPVLSHRGPEFRTVLAETQAGLRRVFGTKRDVFQLAASGTGAMEAALANVLSPGDELLIVMAGQFG